MNPLLQLNFPENCTQAIALGMEAGRDVMDQAIGLEGITTPQEGLAFITAQNLTGLMQMIEARLDGETITPPKRQALLMLNMQELINHLTQLKADLAIAKVTTHEAQSEMAN